MMSKHSDTDGVSIISPTYNSVEILYETINSIFGQSNKNFEWIVVARDHSK